MCEGAARLNVALASCAEEDSDRYAIHFAPTYIRLTNNRIGSFAVPDSRLRESNHYWQMAHVRRFK